MTKCLLHQYKGLHSYPHAYSEDKGGRRKEEEKKQQLPSGMATCAFNTRLRECGTETGRLLELTGISLSKMATLDSVRDPV